MSRYVYQPLDDTNNPTKSTMVKMRESESEAWFSKML